MQRHWDTSGFPILNDEKKVSPPSKFRKSMSRRNAPETSTTRISKDGRFTTNDTESATQVLVSILSEDELFKSLHMAVAIHTRALEFELSSGVRRALIQFKEDLYVEAKNHLECQAWRLVDTSTAEVAANYFMNASRRMGTGHRGIVEDKSVESQLVHADSGDSRAIRLFLMESSAYTKLQVGIHAAYMECLHKLQKRASLRRRPSPATKGNMERNWHSWQEDTKELARNLLLGFDRLLGAKVAVFLLLDFVFLMTDDIFIDLGWLEPPLPEPGWTRIRCEYSYGDRFFDDFMESGFRIGTLVEAMQQALPDANITVFRYQRGSENQRYTGEILSWLLRISRSVLRAFKWQSRDQTGLPRHNGGGIAMATGVLNASGPQQQPTLHLMACVHRARDETVLLQNNVSSIDNDRALFSILKSRISRRRNRMLLALSCRSIQGIFFSKFLLFNSTSVEVRHHIPSCQWPSSQPGECNCVPPPRKVYPSPAAEYRCKVSWRPDNWPLVGPQTLLHMLKCPDKINEKSTWIFNLVPKRFTGELKAGIDHPTEGWGFYFQEGWDFDLIITISFVIVIGGSLLFGVCWSVMKHDIQGAFGVSAYMITACGLIVAFVVSKTG